VMSIWLGKEFSNISRSLLACYGLYFIAHVWRHLNHAMMIGTGQVSKLVGIQLLESALVAIVGWFALQQGGISALLAAMGLIILGLTGTVLPSRVARGLKEG
jgi:multisubunit Na+/H+ antiporter MnhF subunit